MLCLIIPFSSVFFFFLFFFFFFFFFRTISKDLTSIHKATKEETWSEKNSTLLILRTLTNRIVDLFKYLHVELTKIIQGNGTETKESIKDIGNTFSHKHG